MPRTMPRQPPSAAVSAVTFTEKASSVSGAFSVPVIPAVATARGTATRPGCCGSPALSSTGSERWSREPSQSRTASRTSTGAV
ncbi:MAG: hypothetical protein PUA78_04140 [Porphyromonadaceae bacterium]|nr:hypothetical protein [Porphyromonadaceae bacterium]